MSAAPIIIDRAWLVAHRACAAQRDAALAEYGESFALTPALIRSAVGRYDVDWLARRVLTAEPWRVYEAACAEALIAALWPDEVAS